MQTDPRLDAAPEDTGRPPEAAELPEGTVTLARALSELAAILPELHQALESRRPGPPIDRMTLRLDEVADALGVSRRAIERERAANRFPRPDVIIGRMPLWKPETIRDFMAQQAPGRRVRP